MDPEPPPSSALSDSAVELVAACASIAGSLPDELDVLAEQLRQAAAAVLWRCAEGCARGARDERRRSFALALASLEDVGALVDIAHGFSAIPAASRERIRLLRDELRAILSGA